MTPGEVIPNGPASAGVHEAKSGLYGSPDSGPGVHGPQVQRLDRAVLLQGAVLPELEWVLRRGVREIWRADKVSVSGRLQSLLDHLRRLPSSAGSRELPAPATSEESISVEVRDTVSTSEAAALLGVTPRQVRNLSDRVGGRKVGGRLVFDLAAIRAEKARREEAQWTSRPA